MKSEQRQRAQQLMQSGRYRQALEQYLRVVAAEPEDADSWFNAAWLRQQLRDFPGALDGYAVVVRLAPAGSLDARMNRAYILAQHLGCWEQARDEILAALRSSPHSVPLLLNLGRLYEQVGDKGSASRVYRAALASEPQNTMAASRLVTLESEGHDNGLVDLLRSTLVANHNSGLQRADAGFALGQFFDRRGEYADAFRVFSQANAAMRAHLAAEGRVYDPVAHARRVDSVLRVFDSTGPALDPILRDGGSNAFIFGSFRSGSTLLEHMLSRHWLVTAGGELEFFPVMSARLSARPNWRQCVEDPQILTTLRDSYLTETSRRFGACKLLTDKRPDNYFLLGLILRIFPNAYLLHTVRTPIDAGLSIFFCHLGAAAPYACSLSDIGHWYGQYRRLMSHWRALYPDRIHDVVYEDLVTDPEATLGATLHYLGLEWDKACLNSKSASSRAVDTPSGMQVREPLYRRAIGRSGHYKQFLEPLAAALENLD